MMLTEVFAAGCTSLAAAINHAGSHNKGSAWVSHQGFPIASKEHA